jgi:hypothetical protein
LWDERRASVKILVHVYLLATLLVCLTACDIYESEEDDWPNDVTISIVDLTECPLDIFIDGQEKGRLESGETFSEGEFGQGVHLLEAYAWNDTRNSCEVIYTHSLENNETFQWEILSEGNCGECDPTPTATPEATPTPTPTPVG